MTDWFHLIGSDCVLSPEAASRYFESGFLVMPGPFMRSAINPIAAAYDRALATAHPSDVAVGSTSTRLHDLVNRGEEFDSLYLFRPLLSACHRTIGQPFRLSTMLARTVRPESKAQALHSDVRRENGCVGAVGFILMIDDFRADNGSTRFVPGSHQWTGARCEDLDDPLTDYPGQELALGSAGSVVIYDAAVWHGHTANLTTEPRRSIQGMFVQKAGVIPGSRTIQLLPETLNRIGDLAKYLIC
jgi:ectoine hydroxylase-related dioxygenase (phytanoyl-CoA dioxygenase family)